VGELRVIGTSPTVMSGEVVEGDLRLTWDKENEAEVALAAKVFTEYTKKGWLAIGEDLGKKAQIFTFNPDLERIVLAPLAMGG
jgi:hypothetical protein